jgi:hypothetical protein
MQFIDKQLAPPKLWETFEDLTRALFAAVWKSPLTQKNGRSGQAQHGVDVCGTFEAVSGRSFGVQCKGKNAGYGAKATIAEFDAELIKAEQFKPSLGHWTFATTAPNDAPLQEHARLVSEQREKEGKFTVCAIGWDTIQALMSSHPSVVEEFYPEHAGDLPKVMAALRALPTADELDQFRRSLAALESRGNTLQDDALVWSDVEFELERDLVPALMGRSLGPADVAACPPLPEVALLVADLERVGSARLAGVPGAGKSISILQVARYAHDRGWRVLRLADPMGGIPPFDANAKSTLYTIDDAHLVQPALLRRLEERATSSCWVLSAHMISEGRGVVPGAIQLDARRAVQIIASGLRASPETTLAAVRRVDDRVGDRPTDERLDWRLEQAAEQALYPWQFCFILGGGWRRASALASSARAAGADLVLAGAAIRQLATRDARCTRDALMQLVGDALPRPDIDAALDWLLAQRLLLAEQDLRCPHQRLAAVLLVRILEGQSTEGRQIVAALLQAVLNSDDMPLSGLSVLLSELSLVGHAQQWHRLVQPSWLKAALARCWVATGPIGIRDACWFLRNLYGYLPDEMIEVADHEGILAAWLQAAPEGACYALGAVINHVHNTDKVLGTRIRELVNPQALARAISTGGPLRAAEIAHLVLTMRGGENDTWKANYLSHIERDSCSVMISKWPAAAYLSAAAEICKHFCYFEPSFGFELIETLIPAIADRLRSDPQDAFHELNDIVWNALRLYDPLQIFVGKRAPSRRMRQVGQKICACWSPQDLAAKLSRSTHRSFQSAAGVLSFMQKASPKQFEATVMALDWDAVDQAIGTGWVEEIGDARMLLGVAYAIPSARLAIQAMIERNEARIVTMSTHLAILAPISARRHVAAGKHVALCHWGHVDWRPGTFLLATFIVSEPALVSAFLKPHYRGLAEALSQPSPSWYSHGLSLMQLLAQVRRDALMKVLDHIDVPKANLGWRNALRGEGNNHEPGRKAEARQVVALLIHHALDRTDGLGKLARQLRGDFPKLSVPLATTMEPIDLTALME